MTNLNLIIPTYNRPRFLQRILDYYNRHGKDFNIIVADSSSDENKKLNKKIILSFPKLKIQYLDKYPKEIRGFDKFADMINYAKEKYCVFCAEDDFITPNGIKQSVDFLEKNPDFAVAQGRYIDFWLNHKKKKEKKFFYGIRYTNCSIILSDPKNRLIKHLSEYSQPTLYGVHRTDFLKMIYKEFLESKVESLIFPEFFSTMLTIIYGKMKCLDVLYMARQLCPRAYQCQSLIDFVNKDKEKYDEEYAKFRYHLAVHLYKKSQINIQESKKLIDSAFSTYIKKEYSPNLKQDLVNKTKYILNTLHTPDWIYEKIRLLHKKLFLTEEMNNFYVSLNNPLSKYYDDFNKIRSHVISYEF